MLDMRVLFFIATSAILSSCSGGGYSCQNELLDTVASPSGKLSAVVFTRNCGATTGENMQVSVLPRGAHSTEKGNALILDQAPIYSTTFRPTWSSDNSVVLAIPSGARVFARNGRVGEVRVEFSQLK